MWTMKKDFQHDPVMDNFDILLTPSLVTVVRSGWCSSVSDHRRLDYRNLCPGCTS